MFVKLSISLSGVVAVSTAAVAISPSVHKAGDRVAVEFGKDEWFLGVVKSIDGSRYKIVFDDGERHEVDPKHDRIFKVKSRTRTTRLSLAEVRLIRTSAPSRSRTAQPKAQKTVVKKVPRSRSVVVTPIRTPRQRQRIVKPAVVPIPTQTRTPKAPTIAITPTVNINIKETNSLVGEEKTLDHLIGDARGFQIAAKMKDKYGKERYLKIVYDKANKHLFKDQLKPCNMYLQKDMGAQFRRRGVWMPTRRTIGVAPRLFMGQEIHVLTTLVHEMCHQAVSEIDGSRARDQGGHGIEWQTWMRKCGLTPNRYSQYDNENFLSPQEKAKFDEAKNNKEKAAVEVKKAGLKRIWPSEGTPAQYNDPTTGQWVKGLLVCKNDQQGKRWIFIIKPYSNTWKIIPTDWFYELSDETDRKVYTSDAYREAATTIVGYKNDKMNQRSTKRANLSHIRSIFGRL